MSEIETQPVPMLGGSWAGFSRPTHSADEQGQAAINAAARALPDEMFVADPEVQRLRAAHEVKLAVVENCRVVASRLAAEHQRLADKIAAAENEAAWAALSDALQRDGEFSGARACMAGLVADRALLATIGDALSMVRGNNGSTASLHEGLEAARNAISERLHSLKMKEVEPCSE